MTKPRIGRPISTPREGELSALGVRVGPALKTKLVDAAGMNGRSLSAEATARLINSFPADAKIDDLRTLLGEDAGPVLFIAAVLAEAKRHAEFIVGLTNDPDPPGREHWLEDARLFGVVAEHLHRAIDDLRPAGDPVKLVSGDGFDLAPIARKGGVASAIHELVYRESTPAWDRDPKVEILAGLLGPALIRRLAEAHGTTPPAPKETRT